MGDSLGIGASVGSGTAQVTQAAPTGAIAEFATPLPPSALGAALLHATVIGRSADGTILLRTSFGTLSIDVDLTLPPGTSLDLKMLGGTPATAMLINIHEGDAAASAAAAPAAAASASAAATSPTASASALLDVGTTLEATVSGPPSGAPIVPGAAPTAAAAIISPAPGTPLQAAAGAAMTETMTAATDASSAAASTAATNAAATASPPSPVSPATNPATGTPTAPAASPPPSLAPPPAAAPLPPAAPPSGTAGQAPPLAVGSHLVLRVVAPPADPSDTVVLGQVVSGAGRDTVIDTPLGLITLGRRLGLQPGDTLAFEPIETSPPTPASAMPERAARSGGWPALDMTLEALEAAAPALAAQFRALLAPASGADLGSAMLLVMNALYGGEWPGDDIEHALTQSGHDKLRERLLDDTTELRQLADNPATGDWRVLTIPLLAGAMVQPIRIYTRRRKKKAAGEPAEDGGRFIVEVEMSRLGPLQLDGLFRPQRFDLVLRSHRSLSDEIRAEATRIFHNSISASGIAGDIAFSTSARFAVAPMAALRSHVTVNA